MAIKLIDNLAKKLSLKIPLSIGEAIEAVRRRKQVNKETREAHERKEFPTHYTQEQVPDESKQQRFLEYALHFIKQEHPLYWHILMLRMQDKYRGPQGCKKIAIFLSAKGFNVTAAQISKKEAEAVNCVKQTIERVRQTGIPIFEGAANTSGLILAGAK